MLNLPRALTGAIICAAIAASFSVDTPSSAIETTTLREPVAPPAAPPVAPVEDDRDRAQAPIASRPKRVKAERPRVARRRPARRQVPDRLLRSRLLRKHPSKFSWPVTGVMTSNYGPRPRFGFHHGVDLLCRWGRPIHAAKSGRVVWTGKNPFYGNVVVIRHRKGFSTLYGHMQNGLLVRSGERIDRRDPIGRCGSSGRSTGPHVHFEIRRNGRHLNPRPFMLPRRL